MEVKKYLKQSRKNKMLRFKGTYTQHTTTYQYPAVTIIVSLCRMTELVEGYTRMLQSSCSRRHLLQQSTTQKNSLLTEGISHLLKPSVQLNRYVKSTFIPLLTMTIYCSCSLVDKEESKDREVKQQTSEVSV